MQLLYTDLALHLKMKGEEWLKHKQPEFFYYDNSEFSMSEAIQTEKQFYSYIYLQKVFYNSNFQFGSQCEPIIAHRAWQRFC